jgi:hypothetical protein
VSKIVIKHRPELQACRSNENLWEKEMSAQEDHVEKTFIQNEFGTVTSRRVVYYRKKGWFGGGSREDIPLQHVTSVRLEISRSPMVALLMLLMGVGLFGVEGAGQLMSAAFVVMAVLLLWGSPEVVVNTAGRDVSATKGLPWQRSDTNAFVEALRHQIFNRAGAT